MGAIQQAALALGNDLPTTITIWARYKAATMRSVGNGNAVGQWDDIGPNGTRHLTQATSTRKPLLRTSAASLVGNTVAIEFLGTDTDPHSLNLPDMSALTQGAIFAFLKNDTDVNQGGGLTANVRRIWEMGSSSDGYYKYTDSLGGAGIYETFGTTVRKTSGDPAANALTVWHNYSVASASGAWTSWLNNVQHFTTATNTVGFPAAGFIGGRVAGSSGLRLSNKLMAEIVICSVVPTSTERGQINQYFLNEYT